MKKTLLFFISFSILLFDATTANAEYTKLFDFVDTNGISPAGNLVSDGTFLYGTTSQGGKNTNLGMLFKIRPDGTGFDTLMKFLGSNGRSPHGALFYDGTYLYGTCTEGGTHNFGTIFKIRPDGSGYDTLLNFSGLNGNQPWGSLISDGTYLYGTTQGGGTNNNGVIFKIKPDGTGYVKLLDFIGASNGRGPSGSLILNGIYLYGMTFAGGTADLGTVFKIKPDGTGYAKILEFTGANGSSPSGDLISDGTYLYGMTFNGNVSQVAFGNIFKIKPDGTGYEDLHDFSNSSTDGYNPHASLILFGNCLYGMTPIGGNNNLGTIFKINPDGTGYIKLMDFVGTANGRGPTGSFISDGTFLYGTTRSGGLNNKGTIFKYQDTGNPNGLNVNLTLVQDSIDPLTWYAYTYINNGTAPFSYQWNFGDGTGDTLPYPSHTFAVDSHYVITLTVTDVNGFIATTIDSTYRMMPLGLMKYLEVVNNSLLTGTSEVQKISSISIYPNPSNGKFRVNNPLFQIKNINVYNLLGEKISSFSVNSYQSEIDITSQRQGIYFLHIQTVNGLVVEKIVLNK